MFSSGLDIPKRHAEPAYPLEAYGHGHVERILKILESDQAQMTEQGFVNGGVTMEDLADGGLYESPETNAANSILHGNAKSTEGGYTTLSTSVKQEDAKSMEGVDTAFSHSLPF